MAHIQTNRGVTIEYDTFGSPQDPALLLVMGYGAQLINWRPGFCQRLAREDERGRHRRRAGVGALLVKRHRR